VTFVDILIAHGIEPRPEVIVTMYDLVTQTQTEIMEVCRLYDDADLVQEVKSSLRLGTEQDLHLFLLREIKIRAPLLVLREDW
jgi:hypothetical protein